MTEPALRGTAQQDTEATVPSPFTDSLHGHVFETDAWRHSLDELWRALTEEDTVVVIEGEKGAGKTTFLQWFLSRVPGDWDVCHIAARMALGEKHVLARLGRALFPEGAADNSRIAARLVERGTHGPFTVVVVDDADNLSAFALKALFDLKRAVTMSGGRIGIVLAARPFAVEAMFTTPSLGEYRKDWLTSIELPHLTEAETADYVRHRVEAARLDDQLAFDETQLRNIYKGSHGVPLYINRLAKDMLTGARPRRYRTERQQHTRSRRRKTALAVGALGLPLIGLGYAFYALTWQPSAFDVSLEEAVLHGGARSEPEVAGQPEPEPGVAETAGTVDPAARTTTGAPRKETPPVRATAAEGEGPVSGGEKVAVAAAGAATETPEKAAGATGNTWLMSQDPEGYTIQLAGTPEESKAHAFIDKYPLSGDIVAVHTVRGGRTWYMVLYNSYPTLAAARADINELPPAVRRNQPFARRFASVQAIAAE